MSARSHNCSPRTGPRRRIVGSLLAGGLIAAALLAGPTQLAAQGSAPPPEALEKLEAMNETIREAWVKNDRGKARTIQKLAGEAGLQKVDFIRAAFRDQTLHGCSAIRLISLLDGIDGSLAAGLATDNPNSGAFGGAAEIARNLVDALDDCAGKRERAIADEIAQETSRLLIRFGKLSAKRERERVEGIASLKRKLVAGQQVYGCDVVDYYVLIESIDVALVTADALPRFERRKRGEQLRRAAEDAETLIERWRLVPCGETPPPPPGGFTVEDRLSWFHVNGFGTPPSRECNFVSTSPAQPGAQVTDVITRPSPQPQVTKTATTDGGGDAVISMNIDQTGTYTHQTTVTNQAGVQATDTKSQTVTSANTGANGQCPAPTP